MPCLPMRLVYTLRLRLEASFRHKGIDYTRHLWIREGERKVKMYLLIFICLSVGAVHIEVVSDIRVLSFLQALVRFPNLYCIPSVIYSNNTKIFLGGGHMFRKLLLCHDFK